MQNISEEESRDKESMAQPDIRKELFALAEPEYREFSASLIPGAEKIMGVRLPNLRKFAKKLVKEDWRNSLTVCGTEYFEERMLQGFLIGYAWEYECRQIEAMKRKGKITDEEAAEQIKKLLAETLRRTAEFLSVIDNWSICDSFCATLKCAKACPDELWGYLIPLLHSEREYTVRFALVMLLNYYISVEWIDRLFALFDSVTHPAYYVKMANAWAVSICYVKFPEKTEDYLSNCSLDDFTYNKALQKITESLCIDKETKKRIRAMKRKAC